jgi:hypothetical protein
MRIFSRPIRIFSDRIGLPVRSHPNLLLSYENKFYCEINFFSYE